MRLTRCLVWPDMKNIENIKMISKIFTGFHKFIITINIKVFLVISDEDDMRK